MSDCFQAKTIDDWADYVLKTPDTAAAYFNSLAIVALAKRIGPDSCKRIVDDFNETVKANNKILNDSLGVLIEGADGPTDRGQPW